MKGVHRWIQLRAEPLARDPGKPHLTAATRLSRHETPMAGPVTAQGIRRFARVVPGWSFRTCTRDVNVTYDAVRMARPEVKRVAPPG